MAAMMKIRKSPTFERSKKGRVAHFEAKIEAYADFPGDTAYMRPNSYFRNIDRKWGFLDWIFGVQKVFFSTLEFLGI